MVTFGIYNLKGGVGKTASAVNLAYLAAAGGAKTLIWDLDPQGAAGYYLRYAYAGEGSVKRVVKGKDGIKSILRKTQHKNLSLIPADFAFRNIDIALDDMKKSRSRIRDTLKPLRAEFDVIFLDSPPGITLMAENIFKAADFLLVPVIPTTLSLRTLEQIRQFYLENELDPAAIVPFFSMVQERKKLHRESMATLWAGNPKICKACIPFSSEIEKMGLRKKPVNARKSVSAAGVAYRALWREICEKTGVVSQTSPEGGIL